MYLLIDLGGTLTRVGVSKDLKTIDGVEKFPTQKSLGKQKFLLNKALQKLRNGQRLYAAAIGIAGIAKDNTVIRCANIPYLENQNTLQLLDETEELSNLNAFTVNDAALAALGEATYGAAKGFKSMAYLTLSTGVGGTRIANNTLDFSQEYFEPGHHYIKDGITFEQCCSATAFEKLYRMEPKKCKDQKIWNSYAKDLATGILSVYAFWAPDIIVLGGRIGVHNYEDFIQPLKTNLTKDKFWGPLIKSVPIVQSTLMDNNGLHGAMALLRQML